MIVMNVKIAFFSLLLSWIMLIMETCCLFWRKEKEGI